MTVPEYMPEKLAFKVFEDLKDKLLYGMNPEELAVKTEELIQSYLYLKAASFQQTASIETIHIPKQWIWPEAHHFLEAIIESRDKNLIYEWSQILKSKSAYIPLNIIGSLLEWMIVDLKFAHFIIPVLGNAGIAIAEMIPEWNLFSSNHWKHPLTFQKQESRTFAFKQFRIHDCEKAFIYFLENHQHVKDAEKIKWISLLKYKIADHEIEQLIEIFDNSKVAFQFELVRLSLYKVESEYYQNCKSNFLNCLKENVLDSFQFSSLRKKTYNWTNSFKIKCIPPGFLETEDQGIKYIEWINIENEEWSLLDTLRNDPNAPLLKWHFKNLLNNHKLIEDYPTALLSVGFDYPGFNQACIQWIDTTGDQLDLEAFLHFINLEKHFWSDELLSKILELRNNKVLDRKYDFTIFWQLLPYKINPNSVHIKSIPAECRIFMSSLINFDSILQFRKMIRR